MFVHHPVVLQHIKVVAVAIGFLGIFLCFFGYRFFKIFLGILGFAACGWVAGKAGYDASSGNEFIALVSGVLGGAVGAALFVVLYYIGVFLTGAIFATLILTSCAGPSAAHLPPLLLLGLACVGGLLALIVQKFVIILSTASTGAWLIVFGIFHFRHGSPEVGLYAPHTYDRHFAPLALVWLLLGIAGVLVQYLVTARPLPARPPAKPTEPALNAPPPKA